VFSFGACSRSEKRELEILQFNVDTSLVASRIADTTLNISYTPPKNWERMLPDTLKHLNVAEAHTNVIGIFHDSLSNAGLIVTQIDSFQLSDSANVIARAVKYYKGIDPQTEVRNAAYQFEEFKVLQIMILEKNSVTLKMIFERSHGGGSPFEFDFLVPKQIYPTTARVIESVVGSLQTNNPLTKKE
jgi:hypothetical protein